MTNHRHPPQRAARTASRTFARAMAWAATLLTAGALLLFGAARAQTPAAAGAAVATPVGNTAAVGGANGAPSATASATASAASSAAAPATTSAPALTSAAAPVAAPAPAPAGLDERVQDLKAEVIRLNRDLLVLEEELLFPASTQVALFVSMDVGRLFELESVQIRLNDKVVTNYLYTPLEVQALHRGGVQRVYVGNLKTGGQRIDAFFTGKGPHERDYKRATTLSFDKGSEPKYIELRIADKLGKLQPEFEVKVWQ